MKEDNEVSKKEGVMKGEEGNKEGRKKMRQKEGNQVSKKEGMMKEEGNKRGGKGRN